MSSDTRLLLFGGSFDPVHHGHLIVARHVAEQLGVGRVVLIPSQVPPHKTNVTLAAVSHRLEMCRRAVAGDPTFEVSDWEASQPGPNYTLHTVKHFQMARGADVELYWLLGMDSLHELHTWYRAADLVEACTIVTALRPGYAEPTVELLEGRFSASAARRLVDHVLPGPQIDISSTDIRLRVRTGASIRYLVPLLVEAYIGNAGLYK